jgi:hypothetical protein
VVPGGSPLPVGKGASEARPTRVGIFYEFGNPRSRHRAIRCLPETNILFFKTFFRVGTHFAFV